MDACAPAAPRLVRCPPGAHVADAVGDQHAVVGHPLAVSPLPAEHFAERAQSGGRVRVPVAVWSAQHGEFDARRRVERVQVEGDARAAAERCQADVRVIGRDAEAVDGGADEVEQLAEVGATDAAGSVEQKDHVRFSRTTC